MPDYFTAAQGNLFIQPDGPNTPPVPLGCHDLGDIVEALGDVSQRYYLDANGVYVPILDAQGMPGRVTTSITTFLGSVRDELEGLHCPFPLYVNRSTCGRKDVFLNYDRGSVLANCRTSTRTRSNNVSREGTDASEQTFDINASYAQDYFPLMLSYQTSIETLRLWDICFITDPNCASSCGPARDDCSIGFMCAATVGGGGVHAFVYYTLNGGATWTQCTGVPFGHAEHIFCCECFYVTRDTVRVIVGRSLTDGANPAEIAWSDDYGVTWNNVNLGAVVAEFLPWNGSLFVLDNRHLWAGTDAGKLWFSEDGGLTWALSLSAGTDVMDIKFRDEHYGLVVCNGGNIYRTLDGGITWLLVTEPAADAGNDILACEIIDINRMWIGFSNAHLYYTKDGGDTWTQRNLPLYPGMASFTAFSAMRFIDAYCGWLSISCLDAPGHIYSVYYRTVDGGADWEYWIATGQLHAAYGPGGIHACSYNKCYFVGDPPGGVALGMVGVISG
jgi:photosystem II stability/assembly factor-like uncharacterized protein